MRALAAAVALLACTALAPRAASAEDRLPLRLRGSAGAGFVMSADQHTVLALDLPVTEGRLSVGWIAADFLVLELMVAGGAFFSSARTPGALLDASLGAELGVVTGIVRPLPRGPLRRRPHRHAGAARPAHRRGPRRDRLGRGRARPGARLRPRLPGGRARLHRRRAVPHHRAQPHLPSSRAGASSRARPEPPPPPRRVRRRPPPPPPPPTPTAELMVLIDEAAGTRPRELLVPVLFAFDSTEIVPCSLGALHALREHLEQHPEIRLLEIEGHADGSGSEEYNDALSLRRAEAIRDWLVARGVAPERLRVAARGEGAPVESNDEDAGREQNRRARFRVIAEEGAP
ncbi:MAG: OmpA family protein [Sandaracinaceae bacterium]|nr:OmpA family protein [Sandaracinaceae bacterium]